MYGDIYGSVIDLPSDAYDRVAALDRRFPDLNLGFVDAAVAVMADRMRVPRVATADRRHFEPLAGALGFEILP